MQSPLRTPTRASRYLRARRGASSLCCAKRETKERWGIEKNRQHLVAASLSRLRIASLMFIWICVFRRLYSSATLCRSSLSITAASITDTHATESQLCGDTRTTCEQMCIRTNAEQRQYDVCVYDTQTSYDTRMSVCLSTCGPISVIMLV